MKKWTDQNGVKAPINELGHSHLKNIIRYLWRLNPWLKPKMDGLGLHVDLESKPMCILYINYILYTHDWHESESEKRRKNYVFQLNGDIAQDWNDMNEDYDQWSDESPLWNNESYWDYLDIRK